MQLLLPAGFERENNKLYEEVNIPPSDPAPTNIGSMRVAIADLDEVLPSGGDWFHATVPEQPWRQPVIPRPGTKALLIAAKQCSGIASAETVITQI